MRTFVIWLSAVAIAFTACTDDGGSDEQDSSADPLEAGHVPGDESEDPEPDADRANTDSGGEASEAGTGVDDGSTPGADTSTPEADATIADGSMDGGGTTVEAGQAMDGQAGSQDAQADANIQGDGATSPVSYVCHTAAGSGNLHPGVVLASGLGSPYAIRGNRLLSGRDTGSDQNFPAVQNWSLWSLSDSKLIADPLAVPPAALSGISATGDGTIVGVGASSFLLQIGTSTSALRSLEDGSELWNSPCLPGGLAPNGAYAWLTCPTNAGPGLTQFTARNSDGTVWLDLTRTPPSAAIATDAALIAVSSNSTDTTLTVYPRAGGSPTTVGPVAGSYIGVFEDQTHFVTRAAGDLIRVYTMDGTRKALTTATADRAGGRAGVFWLATRTPKDLSFFSLAATPTKLHSTSLERVSILHDGLAISQYFGAPQWERVVISGTSVTSQQNTGPGGLNVTSVASSPEHLAYGIGDPIPSGSPIASIDSGIGKYSKVSAAIVVDGSPIRLGCGPLHGLAMLGNRLFVGTRNAGLFIYEPPFTAPIKRLPFLAFDVRVAHLSGRFAVLSPERIRVFNPDFSLVGEVADLSSLNQDLDHAQIELSPDGTLLSYVLHRRMAQQILRRVVRISNGEVVYERTSSDDPLPLVVLPPVISPSNHRIMDNTEGRVVEDGTLVGTFNGVATAWVDEDRMAAFIRAQYNPGFSTGNVLVNYEGIQQGNFGCVAPANALSGSTSNGGFIRWSGVLQWLDEDTLYSTGGIWDVCSGCQCELPTGTSTEIAPGMSWNKTAGFAVYPGGALYQGEGSVLKVATP